MVHEGSDSEDPDSVVLDSDESVIEDEAFQARAKESRRSRDKFYSTMPASLRNGNEHRAHEKLHRRLEREQYRLDRWARYEEAQADSDSEDEDAKARATARKVARDLKFARSGGDEKSKRERGQIRYDRFRRHDEERKRQERNRREHEERKVLATKSNRETQVTVPVCKRER